jgi:acetoin utilization deacetylase AcuC-like enzyme
MTLLYLDDSFANHRTGSHPECPARILRLNELLKSNGWDGKAVLPGWKAADPVAMAAIHGNHYLEQLKGWDQRDAGQVEADTIVRSGSWNAAVRAAGAACDAVDRILKGEDQRAFAVIRPPGHHALKDAPMGFCLLNNVAIAAKYALTVGGLDRVLIVDWDVHHGNGTQDVFWEDDQVGFFSSHRFPFYPGSGKADETGARRGLGWTCNLPLPGTVTRDEFFQQFTRSVETFADFVKPQLILLSAGFDAHVDDPVGGLCLQEQDFAELTRLVSAIAHTHCQGRIVSLLEGGYHLQHMPLSAMAHLQALHETRSNQA